MKLLKFYKESCPSCVLVTQYLNSKGIEHEAVNPFENPDVASNFEFMSVPVTFLLDDEGKEVKRSTGYNPAELDAMIAQL